jgi:hypothetical protein
MFGSPSMDHARPPDQEAGRSAFVRDAVELYLATKRRRDVDRQIATAYATKSHDLLVPRRRGFDRLRSSAKNAHTLACDAGLGPSLVR